MFDGLDLGPRVRHPQRLILDERDPINRGLVAWWPLAEPHAAFAEDIGPRGYRLTSVTWPTRIVGARGRATSFAGGSGQYLQNSSLVWPGGQHAAISCWINVAGSTNGSPYDFGGNRALASGNAFYGHLPYGDNNAYFYYGGSGSGEISTSLAAFLNQWIHVAWAASPTRKAIWINGRLVNESGTVSAAVASGTNAYLGYSGASSMFHYGAVRMFRLRARAWTDAEVARLYRDDWAGATAPEDRLFIAFSRASAVSVSLTGVAMTASAGSLVAAIGMDAGGEAVTGSAGSVGAAIGVAASGSAATASAGTPTSAIAMSASGVSMTVSAGSLTYSLAFTLTGVASTSASGTLAADKGSVGRTLTGISMTALPGNVRVTGGTRWRPSEAQAVTPPSMVGNTLQPPPRLVGDPAADNRAIQQWLQTLYDHVIKRDNVLGRIADHENRIASLEASNDNGST